MPQIQQRVHKKVTRASRLKSRMRAIKPTLLAISWDTCKTVLLKYYPEYNTFDSFPTIKNVWEMKGSDTKLTEIFEDIANGRLKLLE